MSSSLNSLQVEISQLIVECLNLENVDPASIDPEVPLFGDGLGLDSIDALEIGAALSQRYCIKIKAQGEAAQQHFVSVRSLAQFVAESVAVQEADGGEAP